MYLLNVLFQTKPRGQIKLTLEADEGTTFLLHTSCGYTVPTPHLCQSQIIWLRYLSRARTSHFWHNFIVHDYQTILIFFLCVGGVRVEIEVSTIPCHSNVFTELFSYTISFECIYRSAKLLDILGSMCGTGMVDKSVDLLGNNNKVSL